MKEDKCTVILLAAGKGTRMGSEIPKQFMNILDKPVIYYSLNCFQNSRLIDEVIVVASKEMLPYCKKEIVDKFRFTKVRHMIAGGAERYDSVYEGLKCCENTSYVFIHDGARPFVTDEMLSRGYEEVKASGACIAGVPTKDTVKLSDGDKMVVETPDRNSVWMVQTPQIFDYSLIRRAYDRLQNFNKEGITDDAMVLETMEEHPVQLFMGSYRNIKITTEEDLEIAELFAKKLKKM